MSSPWLKFYPSDWRADPALRMCSVGARGLWMEMLCLMHEANGSLTVNGKQIQPRQLASLAGCSVEEVSALMEELAEAGVFSLDDDGTIFSRRMRKDIAKAETDKANGKKGGNPAVKGGVNPLVNGEDKAQKPEARDQTEGSVATATGTVVPIKPQTPRERLWTEGRPALMALGVKERAAGEMMGRWLKDASDDHRRVLDAILRAREMAPTGPIAWITAHLKTEKPHAGKPESVQDAARALRQWATGGSPFDA